MIHTRVSFNSSYESWFIDGLKQLSVQIDQDINDIIQAAVLEKYPQLRELKKGFIGRVLSPLKAPKAEGARQGLASISSSSDLSDMKGKRGSAKEPTEKPAKETAGKQTPQAEGRIKQFTVKTGDDFDALIDAIDATKKEGEYFAIGLRGLYKDEVGKRKLNPSNMWEDGNRTKRKLGGTSTVLVVPDWDNASVRDLVLGLKNANVGMYGDAKKTAIVKGSLLIDEIAEDSGEAILGNAEVIGYLGDIDFSAIEQSTKRKKNILASEAKKPELPNYKQWVKDTFGESANPQVQLFRDQYDFKFKVGKFSPDQSRAAK